MKRLARDLRRGLDADFPILAAAACVWAVLVILLAAHHIDGLQPASYRSNLLIYLTVLAVLGVVVLIARFRRDRPDSPLRYLREKFAAGGAGRLLAGLPMFAALIVFMPVFSAMKSAIPLFHEFTWDAAIIAADHALHGQDPWRLLQPVLGYPLVTSALSGVYLAWFFVIYAASTYFCFLAGDRTLRAQYFITYFATWTLGGVLLATLFASVGPCFAGPLLGDHRFDAQMEYLRAANDQYPVFILRAQDFLLAAAARDDNGLGAGISAMPSMHVAMAMLVALSMARLSRGFAVAGWTFYAAILIGSVHLGPHYALDGYVSSALTLALWAIAGRLAVAMGAARAAAPAADPVAA